MCPSGSAIPLAVVTTTVPCLSSLLPQPFRTLLTDVERQRGSREGGICRLLSAPCGPVHSDLVPCRADGASCESMVRGRGGWGELGEDEEGEGEKEKGREVRDLHGGRSRRASGLARAERSWKVEGETTRRGAPSARTGARRQRESGQKKERDLFGFVGFRRDLVESCET